jgi:hypothetical protein
MTRVAIIHPLTTRLARNVGDLAACGRPPAKAFRRDGWVASFGREVESTDGWVLCSDKPQ